MIKNGGTAPENLPTVQDIKEVRKSIKKTHKKMLGKDKK